ncbi:enoyl-CoA hydratase/isomerase family protein [Microbacterium resistens]|uniref:enoyl-CoA hydratase/isomerase family protein n=1 Tax=Microbacterium resistens TaxID=156977 RepID=UPI001C56B442|nr:enoyl-CoA hydratase/isomerase family protein [Microbacterium resistens]MBW1638470.1 enoyl-CoA hydratase/isomerase family protein [Microbacterium resistens]
MTNIDAEETAVHPNLQVRDIGHVRVLRIDREDKLGAFSSSLVSAIGAEVSRVRQTPSVRVVILTGTGRGFVAGADIEEYSNASAEEFAEYQRRSRAVFDDLSRLPQATIAAVNGYAFGGGFEIALCCDFIFAADSAKFGLPEIKLGLIPGGGGPQRLVREVGARWTKELVMSGRTVTADELYARGIATRVVARDELQTAAVEFASELAAQPRQALREAKQVIDSGRSQDLETALSADQLALARLFSTSDGAEGIRAFVEKRPPEFDQE